MLGGSCPSNTDKIGLIKAVYVGIMEYHIAIKTDVIYIYLQETNIPLKADYETRWQSFAFGKTAQNWSFKIIISAFFATLPLSQTKTPPMVTKPMEETEWKKLTDCRRTQDLEGGFAMMPLLFSSCCLDADLVFPHVCQNWSNEVSNPEAPEA